MPGFFVAAHFGVSLGQAAEALGGVWPVLKTALVGVYRNLIAASHSSRVSVQEPKIRILRSSFRGLFGKGDRGGVVSPFQRIFRSVSLAGHFNA